MTRFFSLLLLLCASVPATSQNLDSLLLVQKAADPQEKVYVQFDKSYYNAGETVWFKAYLFTGIDPSEVSKNFYAELLDEQGNVIGQRTAPVLFAGASGSFELDSSFNKPLVYFRGYTLSNLNSDTSFIYTKAIRVLSPNANAIKRVASTQPPALKFLPEGGNWVAGLPARLAFAATNVQEMPVEIKGTITDNTGEKAAEFTSLHNGMGVIPMVPQAGKIYTATWKDESGKQYTTPLPAFQSQGVVLKITDEKGNKRFTIYRSEGVPAEMKQLHVIGYINQQMAFKSDINMEARQVASGVFPTSDLPSTILQITVFDNNYKPLAERISFINNHNYEFDGDAYFLQRNFNKRGLNQVEILLSDTIPANLSIAITDADLHETARMDDNIVSRMLLTGELRGKIVRPYYYFFSNSDSAGIHLDLVMLTHGWRRYNWDNVLAGRTTPPRYKETNYLTMAGKVNGLLPGSIGTDLQLVGILQTADSAKSFFNLPVDRNGKVFADGLIFYDNAKLYFNFNKKSLSFDKSMLLLDNGLRKAYKKIMVDTSTRFVLREPDSEVIAGNIKNSRIAEEAKRLMANSRMMETITVKARAKTEKDKMDEKYASGLFSGGGNSFDLLNDPLSSAYTDVFQYLQGKVAGLQIVTGATPTLSWRGGTPAVYLNEMQTQPDMLASIPVNDIAYIKVFRPGESIVMGGGGGVIAIYTRKGGDVQPEATTKGLSYVQLMGYSPVKEFYSPDYSTAAENHTYTDARTTLYWNPSIILDKNKRRLRIRFYNNDMTKRFRVIMEGLNAYGKLIHVEKEVEDMGKIPTKM